MCPLVCDLCVTFKSIEAMDVINRTGMQKVLFKTYAQCLILKYVLR